jgi:hypothetical protein
MRPPREPRVNNKKRGLTLLEALAICNGLVKTSKIGLLHRLYLAGFHQMRMVVEEEGLIGQAKR